MENEVNSNRVTYQHPTTDETVTAIVHGRNLREATAKALANNVPTQDESFYWKLVSIVLIEE
jgi:hypothetical protein